jgi:hypothetical protein
VKESLKWHVDRTSASNKLRELTDWAKHIGRDIQHKRFVRQLAPVRAAMDYW